MLEKIAKILSEISKTLKELTQIQKERLDLEREVVRENKKGMKEAMKLGDMVIGKTEQVQKDLLEMLGIPEKVDIDGIEGVDSTE